MPLVRIEFDDGKASDQEIQALSEAVKDIVVEATGIEDVFVYGNSARIKINIAPIEIFIELSQSLASDLDALSGKIREGLSLWKKEHNFSHPINLTIIPMQWKFEIGI